MFDLWIIPVGIIVIYLLSSIKILREYERGVIFRLGRVLANPKGPGIILVFAPIDRMVRISFAWKRWRSQRRTWSLAITSRSRSTR